MRILLAIFICLLVFVLLVAVYNDGYRAGLETAIEVVDEMIKQYEEIDTTED